MSDATSLDTLSTLRRYSAAVRVLDDLHAKVYPKRQADGTAIGFTGSANLTNHAATRRLCSVQWSLTPHFSINLTSTGRAVPGRS